MINSDIYPNSSMVSVCMITYGHEQYIKDAIYGVLMQETNFDVELIIADDHSPDNTEEIVKKIVATHPNGHWIKYTRHAKNKGMLDNFIWALNKCSGKYIALCEGDDYWIDKNKLQKQFEILEDNEDCSFCFHRGLKINTVTSEYGVYPELTKNKLNPKEFFSFITIPMASVFFRNSIDKTFPIGHIQPDFILLSKLMSQGMAYYHPEIMSVYRKHIGGISYNNHKLSYISKRIDNLLIESRLKDISTEVREEIIKVRKNHIKILLRLHKKNLSFFKKWSYRFTRFSR